MANYYDPYMDDQQQQQSDPSQYGPGTGQDYPSPGLSGMYGGGQAPPSQAPSPSPSIYGDPSLQASRQDDTGEKTPWWAKLLAGGVMAGGAALASKSHAMPEFLAGAISGYANERSRLAAEQRKQKFIEDENLRKTAHDVVMKFQGQDLSKYPELQRLQSRYQQALGKDSPGGSIITAREAADIIAHGQVASKDFDELRKQQAHDAALEKARNDMAAQQEEIKAYSAMAQGPPAAQPSDQYGPGTDQDYPTTYATPDQEAMQQYGRSQLQRLSPERQVMIQTPSGPMMVPVSAAAQFAGKQVTQQGEGERSKARLEEQKLESEKNRSAAMDRLTMTLAAKAASEAKKNEIPDFSDSLRKSPQKGVQYISASDAANSTEAKQMAEWARANKVKFVSKDNGAALQEVGNAIQDLKDAYEGVKAQMPSTVAGAWSNRALANLQFTDAGAAMKAYNDTIADIAMRLGRATSGKSGLRFNVELIKKMIASIPNPTTDTAKTAEEKMSRLNTYLKNVEEPILGSGAATSKTLRYNPDTGEFEDK